MLAAPPAGIEIINREGASVNKVEIAEKKEVELECRVRESKPAATIVWYRDNVELKLSKCKPAMSATCGRPFVLLCF